MIVKTIGIRPSVWRRTLNNIDPHPGRDRVRGRACRRQTHQYDNHFPGQRAGLFDLIAGSTIGPTRWNGKDGEGVCGSIEGLITRSGLNL